MTIQIAQRNALELPLDFVTERIAFIARTGAGKSGGMRVLAEEFIQAGQFVVIIDPVKGDLWGVRAAGHGPGLPVLVMGGDHGDVPLEPHAGKIIAEFLVRERVSTVLDLSDFSKANMVRFVADLASTLYRRNRDVMHVFIDEADAVAGEKFYDPKCLESIQMIQNKGRGRGFGVTVATQRSAMINKSVLFASGTLIAMQTTSPKDVGIVKEWLDVAGTPEATKEIIKELPKLKTREAFVYSPQLLGADAKRITFRSFGTFDSMRTPRPGEARQKPKSLAQIDLAAVTKEMAATIEEAKANDPQLLKAEIARLKREFSQQKGAVDPGAIEAAVNKALAEERRKNAAIVASKRDEVATVHSRLLGVEQAFGLLKLSMDQWRDDSKAPPNANGKPPAAMNKSGQLSNKTTPIVNKSGPARNNLAPIRNSDASLPIGERKILTVVAQTPAGICTREELTVVAGYKRSSRDAYLQRLHAKGYIEIHGREVIATPEGVESLGDFETLPIGRRLAEYWFERLPEGEARILRFVHDAGRAVSRDEISEAVDYKRSSRDAYIQRLKARQLVATDSGGVQASPLLFD